MPVAVPVCVLQGYGVIGSTSEGPEEIEHAPALSLTLGSLPGTTLHISHITGQQLPDGGEWMAPGALGVRRGGEAGRGVRREE